MTYPPIYICGCGHSGTTLMFRILSEHSAIYGAPNEMFRYDPSHSDEEIRSLENKLHKACEDAGGKRWLLKEPLNLLSLKRIFRMNPDARVIIMLRDGRDVALSFEERGHIKSFKDCVVRWKTRAEQTLPWQNHPQVKIVKLEDLVSDSGGMIREILLFLKMDYEYLLDYWKIKKSIFTGQEICEDSVKRPRDGRGKANHRQLRNWECNQPIMNRTRWRHGMSKEKMGLFRKLAGNMLERFDYPAK